MKSLVALLLVIVACTDGLEGADARTHKTSSPTAQELTNQIRSKGAEAVLAELFAFMHDAKANDQEITKVLSAISSGSNEWLVVGRDHYLASDGGAAEDLGAAFADALEKNPEGVLKQLDTPRLLYLVCTGGSTDVEEADFLKGLTRRRAALSRVRDKALANRRDECSKYIDDAEKGEHGPK